MTPPERRAVKAAPNQRASGPRLLVVAVLVVVIAGAGGVSALTTLDGKILGPDGQEIKQLIGANWFGFNNGNTMVLTGDDTLGFAHDFASVVYRWQLLGFNAIRLPFSFAELLFFQVEPIVSTCMLPSMEDIAYSVTDPKHVVPNTLEFPPPKWWPEHERNTCNGYIPDKSVLARFVWVVRYLAYNDFYVVIDCHTEDYTPENNPNMFVKYWADLVAEISKDAKARQHLIVDILNEPDVRSWGWDVMGPLYHRVMDAVHAFNPDVLFLVEGTGQTHLGANWGDGFQTRNIQLGTPEDPNPFFQELLGKPYRNQVALSPHVYGPAVTFAGSGYAGSELFRRLTASFGHLTKQGYTHAGDTQRFAVVIGETGSFFTDAGDLQFMDSFLKYLLNKDEAHDGLHDAIPHMLYWCWNSDSHDTGGLVDDTEMVLQWRKLRWLADLGMTPWYRQEGVRQRPRPPPSVSPGGAVPPVSRSPPRPPGFKAPPAPPPGYGGNGSFPTMPVVPPPRPPAPRVELQPVGVDEGGLKLEFYAPSGYALGGGAGHAARASAAAAAALLSAAAAAMVSAW